MRFSLLLLLCAGLFGLTTARPTLAQPLVDPVEKLRNLLNDSFDSNPKEDEINRRIAAVRAATANLKSIPEMLQGLLVPEGSTPIDDKLNKILQAGYQEIQSALEKRILKQINSTLEGTDAIQQGALLTLIRSATEDWRSSQPSASATIDGLERFRPAIGEIAKSMIPLVGSPSEDVQIAAVLALSLLDTSRTEIAAAFTSTLKSGSLRVRRAVGEALGNLSRLIASRKNSQSYTLAAKVDVMVAEFAVIRQAMLDSDFLVRRRATNAALQMLRFIQDRVDDSRNVPPPLYEDPEKKKARPENEFGADARKKVAETLVADLNRLGASLRTAGQDSDTIVRALAFEAIEQLALIRRSLPAPMPPMKETRREVELGSPIALAQPRPAVVPVVYLARPVAVDEELEAPKKNQSIREGVDATLPALQAALTDPNIRVRLSAIEALHALGEDAEPVIPALVLALNDRDRFVRWAAARVLGGLSKIDKHTRTIVAGLTKLLCEADTDVRTAAIRALAEYKAAALPALSALADQMVKADYEVRLEAIKAIVAIGAEAAPAIPALAENLTSIDARVRRAAAEALGRFGPRAVSALPKLEAANFDEDLNVRRAAAGAVLRIRLP